MIPDEAVKAAQMAGLGRWQNKATVEAMLEAAAPILAAQVLRDAVEAFPLETITAPDNAVVWLTRRAEQIEGAP